MDCTGIMWGMTLLVQPQGSYSAIPFLFTGELMDGDWLYLRARYYNPSTGVFPSLDPFEGMHGRPMSLNGYSWVEGNPVMNTDPSGELALLGIFAAAALGGLIGGLGYGAYQATQGGEGCNGFNWRGVGAYGGAGLAIGAGIGVAFVLGTVGVPASAQFSMGLATSGGAVSNVIGQGIMGAYEGAATLEELVARLAADMAIGGVFGRIMAGYTNRVQLSGSTNLLPRAGTLLGRSGGIGGINMIQGFVQRGARSYGFGDEGVTVFDPVAATGDFLFGALYQGSTDVFAISATGSGNFAQGSIFDSPAGLWNESAQNYGTITRPAVPNSYGDATRQVNLNAFGEAVERQVFFTIFSTNVVPSTFDETGATEIIVNLFDR